MSETTVHIVGVGNVLMGDDGVGPAAIERLGRRALPRGVRLCDAGLAFSEVLGTLDPRDRLLVIDAVRAGGQPGDLHVLRVDPLRADDDGRPLSLHELSVLPALRLEALAGRVFRDVTVFGVEPGRVGWGEGLSAPVAAALDRLLETVLQHAGAPAPDAPIHEARA